jgi:hypothetical protein
MAAAEGNANTEVRRAARRAAADRLRTRKAPRQSPSRRSHAFENAYYIIGHGSDNADIPQIQVPDDYAVIVKADPGQNTQASNTNIPLYDNNRQPYINPFKKANLLYLIDKYKFMSIFGEGTRSPNFSFTLLGYFKNKQLALYKFVKSGIVQWPFRTKDKFIDIAGSIDLLEIPMNGYLRTYMYDIIDLYEYSIYPTMDQVSSAITHMLTTKSSTTITEFMVNIHTEEHPSHKLFNISLSELFEKLPKGVIYNFSCRANAYGKKLYTRGHMIDESMRSVITKKDQDTLDARKGLQLILAEAVGVRAPMIRRIYTRSASASASAASGSMSASASATATPLNAETKLKLKSIQKKLKELPRAFTREKLFSFFDYLIANKDIFIIDNYAVKNTIEYLKERLEVFYENLHHTQNDIKHIANFYTAFLQTNIFKKYPPYLEAQIIRADEVSHFNEATAEELIEEYNDIPLHMLKFIHYERNNFPFLMFLANRGKYGAVKHFYDKYPELARIYYYDITLKTATNFTRCIFSRYSNKAIYPLGAAYDEDRDGIMRKIIDKEREHLDHPTVRSQLADPKYHVNAILTIFEPYIKHFKLYDEFPELRESMIEYELLEDSGDT